MLYLGIDHHMKTSHLTVTDESGQILKRKGIATRQDELLKALEEFEGEPIKTVLEASYSDRRADIPQAGPIIRANTSRRALDFLQTLFSFGESMEEWRGHEANREQKH